MRSNSGPIDSQRAPYDLVILVLLWLLQLNTDIVSRLVRNHLAHPPNSRPSIPDLPSYPDRLTCRLAETVAPCLTALTAKSPKYPPTTRWVATFGASGELQYYRYTTDSSSSCRTSFELTPSINKWSAYTSTTPRHATLSTLGAYLKAHTPFSYYPTAAVLSSCLWIGRLSSFIRLCVGTLCPVNLVLYFVANRPRLET